MLDLYTLVIPFMTSTLVVVKVSLLNALGTRENIRNSGSPKVMLTEPTFHLT